VKSERLEKLAKLVKLERFKDSMNLRLLPTQ